VSEAGAIAPAGVGSRALADDELPPAARYSFQCLSAYTVGAQLCASLGTPAYYICRSECRGKCRTTYKKKTPDEVAACWGGEPVSPDWQTQACGRWRGDERRGGLGGMRTHEVYKMPPACRGHSLVYGQMSEIRSRPSTLCAYGGRLTSKRLIPMRVADLVALVPVRGACRL
jgi:hypothetical protein